MQQSDLLANIGVWSEDGGYRAPQARWPVDGTASIAPPPEKERCEVINRERTHAIAYRHAKTIVELLDKNGPMTAKAIAAHISDVKYSTVRVALPVMARDGIIEKVGEAKNGRGAFGCAALWAAKKKRERFERAIVAFNQKTRSERTYVTPAQMRRDGFDLRLVKMCLRGQRVVNNGCMFRYVDE